MALVSVLLLFYKLLVTKAHSLQLSILPMKNGFKHPASSSSDPRAWLLDKGANTHITSDLGNVNLSCDYRGDWIGGVVSGTGLQIEKIGPCIFTHSSHPFTMNKILCSPNASSNILSSHQFSKDNNCYFLIFPNFFCMKDLQTRKTLFQSSSRSGLFRIPPLNISLLFMLSRLMLLFGMLGWVIPLLLFWIVYFLVYYLWVLVFWIFVRLIPWEKLLNFLFICPNLLPLFHFS